jgi:DNA repair exonuclease SbcCD ATPase subunit
VAELEMLVESLKRVIEKQRAEADALKQQVHQHEQRTEKLKSEKQLRQRIEALEAELHSYEMKDVNVGEKDSTIKRLINANRTLKEDLERENERYILLENKHKDLLVQYAVLTKEHERYVDMVFSNTTGGRLNNFKDYLSTGEQHGERANSG